MKKVVIFLSLKPEEGGKFQYSLNILNALTQFHGENVEIQAVITEKVWEEYLTIPFVDIKKNSCLLAKIMRFVIIKLKAVFIWRVLGKYFDPIQRKLFLLKPDIIIYPGNDTLAYECSIQSVIPIFDLMHRYEKQFSEVSSINIYKQREFHYKNICKYAKTILVDSELGKKQVMESYKIDEKKIKVLPYIASRYIFEEVNSSILDKYNLPKIFILYPAQLWFHKNHLKLIEAISLLNKKGLKIHAVFVGSKKNAYNSIIECISKHVLESQIIFLNYVGNAELVALYKNALALVMPTFFGPTNIPPLEAFALGCPVIISDVYDIPMQVGDAALLVDPQNPSDIASKIEMIYRDEKLRTNLIKHGFRKNEEWNLTQFSRMVRDIIE